MQPDISLSARAYDSGITGAVPDVPMISEGEAGLKGGVKSTVLTLP